jgi:hypothetical protein
MMNTKERQPLTTAQVAAYVDAAAVVLDIALAAEYRGGVVANLERLLQMGAEIMSFPLPDEAELAPVFQP